MSRPPQDKSPTGRERSRELAARAADCVRLSTGEDHPNFRTVASFMSVVEQFEGAIDVGQRALEAEGSGDRSASTVRKAANKGRRK